MREFNLLLDGVQLKANDPRFVREPRSCNLVDHGRQCSRLDLGSLEQPLHPWRLGQVLVSPHVARGTGDEYGALPRPMF